jgi:hypothetical protein
VLTGPANAEFLDQRQPPGDHRCWALRLEEEPKECASIILDSITGNWT